MSLQIKSADPAASAEAASRVLTECWPPPAVHYSADYLRFHLSFPGATPPLAVAAFDGDALVGFAATTPRRVRFQGVRTTAHIYSFVAVRPAWQGRGLSAALYSELLGLLRASGVLTVTFVIPGSAGARSYLRAITAAGYHPFPLGAYPSYGRAIRPSAQPSTARAVTVTEEDLAALPEVAAACQSDTALLGDPDPAEIEHGKRDPRSRRLLVARRPDGRPAGAAVVLSAAVVTATGIERIPTVDSLYPNEPSAEVLASLLEAAGRCFPGGAAMVAAPNPWGVDAATARAAGLRRIGAGFEGYLGLLDPHHALAAATSTNLEIT